MPSLDVRGKISAAEIAFYVPVALVALTLTLRYGFNRDAGWVFLLIFSIVRIVGSALLVAAELVTPVNTSLYTTAYVLQSVGIAPLLLAAVGFLGLVGQGAYSENYRLTRVFRFIGLLATVALAISIPGGIDATSTDPSTMKTGITLRRVGVIIYAVVYLLLVFACLICWSYRLQIRRARRNLLAGITIALPFIGVRIAYAVLSAYSTSKPSLAKFNSLTGDWKIYLVMSLVMEYIVVLIYLVTGTFNPLHKDRDYDSY